jgi:hypothetical protein
MPPRLVVKKRPVSTAPSPEEMSVSAEQPALDVSAVSKPKKKRLVKKEVVSVTDPVDVYMSSLNSSDRLVMNIAKDHLGTSFCLEKSVGFVDFLASHK